MTQELERIQEEYNRRKTETFYSDLYSALNQVNLYTLQTRERDLIKLLNHSGIKNLTQTKLLEIGSGTGGQTLNWLTYGCRPENCSGIDLMADRITAAQTILPSTVSLQAGDASNLPYPVASFDLITQFTVFSSILDRPLQQKIAAEMLRVLSPQGTIIWYDFWWNPINPQTKGIRLAEIKALFPDCQYTAKLITLAPPIARRIAPFSTILASIIELLPLRTHWLVAIQKKPS
jgi:ubiquinone/menaquinone biosynthesis C-methylase UbiE